MSDKRKEKCKRGHRVVDDFPCLRCASIERAQRRTRTYNADEVKLTINGREVKGIRA